MLYLRNKQGMAAVVLRKNNGMLYKYNKKGTPEAFSTNEGRRRANPEFCGARCLLFWSETLHTLIAANLVSNGAQTVTRLSPAPE